MPFLHDKHFSISETRGLPQLLQVFPVTVSKDALHPPHNPYLISENKTRLLPHSAQTTGKKKFFTCKIKAVIILTLNMGSNIKISFINYKSMLKYHSACTCTNHVKTHCKSKRVGVKASSVFTCFPGLLSFPEIIHSPVYL